ncbi:MAG: electron transport complex subunit E [Pseudomonadota bacterium]
MTNFKSIDFYKISREGLWKNNAALVQLLGLCPLLAVTGTFINGLGLGIATTLVLIGSNVSVSLIRHFIPKEIRIPIFVMLIASFVTNVQLFMNAFTFELYQTLGIFIPLIVTNCMIIGRAEAFASKNSPPAAAFDGLMQGLGFSLVLMVLGGLREILGQGTLFSGAELLLGDWASQLTLQVFTSENPLLIAVLPPGAFFGLGILIAIKNRLDQKSQTKETQEALDIAFEKLQKS